MYKTIMYTVVAFIMTFSSYCTLFNNHIFIALGLSIAALFFVYRGLKSMSKNGEGIC